MGTKTCISCGKARNTNKFSQNFIFLMFIIYFIGKIIFIEKPTEIYESKKQDIN